MRDEVKMVSETQTVDELKRLLRSAMDDLVAMRSCANCIHEASTPNCKECLYEWKHTDEAERLLKSDNSDS